MSDTARALGLPGEIQFNGQTLKVSRITFEIEGRFERWLEANLLRSLEFHRGSVSADTYALLAREANAALAQRRYAWDGEIAPEAAWLGPGFRELSYLCVLDLQPVWTREEHAKLLAAPGKLEELARTIHGITAPLKNGPPPGAAAPGGSSSPLPKSSPSSPLTTG